MGVIKGKDFMFSILLDGDLEILCHATDFTLNVATKILESTGPANGLWDTFIPAGNSYTLSVPGVVTYTDPLNIVQLQLLQKANTIVSWLAGIDQSGGLQYSGSMFISNTNMTSQFRDAVKFDMAAQGTGELMIRRLPISRQVYLASTKGIRLAGCPNPYPVGILWYDGTFIGVAADADDVMSLFNEYAVTQGGYLTIVGSSGGCDFTMEIAWNSPLSPTFIPAEPGDGFVIGGRVSDEVLGESNSNHNVIGV